MSTLKFKINPLDSIMDKIDKNKIYTILHEELHDIWVWREGEAPKQMPKRMINLSYIKVDPKITRVLYGKANNDTDTIDKPTE